MCCLLRVLIDFPQSPLATRCVRLEPVSAGFSLISDVKADEAEVIGRCVEIFTLLSIRVQWQ